MRPGCIPGKKYAFTAKPPYTPAAGQHDPGFITRMRPGCIPGVLYGSFAGKTQPVSWSLDAPLEVTATASVAVAGSISFLTQGFSIGSVGIVIDASVFPAASGGSLVFRTGVTISVRLTNNNNQPLPNLTGLKWAWWDQPVLNTQIAPTDTGTGATTDTEGVFSVTSLPNSALSAGQRGWLEITNSDGDPGQTPVGKVAAGPVTVG